MSSAESALPPEKLQELRKAVKEQLKNQGLSNQIKSLVTENKSYKPVKGREGTLTQQQAIDELKGRGVIDQLVKSLKCNELVEAQSYLARSHSKQGVHVAVKGVTLKANTAAADQVLICGELFGQRFRSTPVAVTAAQTLEASAFIELPNTPAAQPGSLLLLRHPLHLILLATQAPPPSSTSGQHSLTASPQPGSSPVNAVLASTVNHNQSSAPSSSSWVPSARNDTAAKSTHAMGSLAGTLASTVHTLPAGSAVRGPDRLSTAAHAVDSFAATRSVSFVGSGHAEWRTVLANKTGPCSMTVDLSAAGVQGAKPEPVASVRVDITMNPVLLNASDASALQAQTQSESSSDAAATGAFKNKVKAWVESCCSADSGAMVHQASAHALLQGEDGIERPCSAFVRPLQLGRALSTAREATRFVALLGPKPSAKGRQLTKLHTIMAAKQASQEEKALLLASLLAGLGHDAWVAYGTDAVGSCTWVLTRTSRETVTFLDAAAGTRTSPATAGQAKGCPYRSLSLVFKHRKAFANLQSDTGIAELAYHLEDAENWRELSMTTQVIPGPPLPRFDLQIFTCDLGSQEVRLEAELKKAVTEYRQESLGQASTHWDESLAFLLMSSLAASEQEALTGQPAAQEDFQQCIRRNIPSGFTFKGFPQHHRTLNTLVIQKALLKEVPVQEMLSSQTTEVSFALRVKIFQYPEHVFSVWLMLAMKCPGPKRFSRSSQ